ncbi:MAG TPA: diaminopimelate decarboxylase [Candidatus Limnocylindria bacterium]|nr:diaminopimelate decarboxylase [Candidatus Limnocylindria bacterium]
MPDFSVPDSVFEEAARRFPTPFYLYDEAAIRGEARLLNEAFSSVPGYREYFAVKALPNPAILRALMDEGCGLDCSSRPELMLARRVGAKGEDIMFSANAMPAEELALAREMGALINLDDLSDVPTLLSLGPAPEAVSLRVNPGKEVRGRTSFMGNAADAKYGFMPSQLAGGLRMLKDGGTTKFGLHAMTMSNSLQEGYYAHNAGYLFELGLELERETGLTLAFVNLSGGIGIPYKPEEEAVDVRRVAAAVCLKYRRAFGERDDVRVFSELGRLVTGPHGYLVTRAIHRKDTYRTYIGVDACASNLLRPAMYGAYHHITVAGKREAPADQTYDVTGSLCENNDKFAVQRQMPAVEMGDLLIIHDAGAHGHAMGYQYNGRLRSAEVLYTPDGDFRLIRRAETPEDYFATLV